jgi:sulfur carrier protein ThiS
MKTNEMNATSAAAKSIAAELKRIGTSSPRYAVVLNAVGPRGHWLREEVESLIG